MQKAIRLLIPLVFILAFGCSSNPITSDRTLVISNPNFAPFQLAILMACPEYMDASMIPTNIETGQLVPGERFPIFARYVLNAFDVYDYEPNDWDDWLMDERGCSYEPIDWDDWLMDERSCSYEPIDWDDWLLGSGIPFGNKTRLLHSDASESPEEISLVLDPENMYEPNDWDDWLLDYEPNDWDDWLMSHTIEDIAALRK